MVMALEFCSLATEETSLYGYKYYDKSNKIDLISKIFGFYLLNNIYKYKSSKCVNFHLYGTGGCILKDGGSNFLFYDIPRTQVIEYLKSSLMPPFVKQSIDCDNLTYGLLVADRPTWLVKLKTCEVG